MGGSTIVAGRDANRQERPLLTDEAGRLAVVEQVSGVIHRAKVNVAQSQTDQELIAAVAGKALRVTALAEQCNGVATPITYNSKPAGAGVAISAQHTNGANGGRVLNRNCDGWYQTAVGEGLSCTTGAGSTTGVEVVAEEI